MREIFGDWWASLPVVMAALGAILVLFLLRYHRAKRDIATGSMNAATSDPVLQKIEDDLGASGISLILFDHSTHEVLHANEAALAVFGVRSTEQFGCETMQQPELWAAPPYSLTEFKDCLDKAAVNGLQQFEWRTAPLHRVSVWLKVSLSSVTLDARKAIMFTGVDITALKKAQARETFQHDIVNAMVSDKPLRVTLDHVAAMAEASLPGALCGVMVYDPESGCLNWAGGQSPPSDFRQCLSRVEVDFGITGNATAVVTRGRIVCRDIHRDDRWDECFREAAIAEGIRATWSEPVFGNGNEVLATIEVYHDRPWTPSADDVESLALPVLLTGLAVERERLKK